MNKGFDRSIMDSIFDDTREQYIYTTYLDKKHLQQCTLYFNTIQSVPDKNRNINQNILINGIAIDMMNDRTRYTNKITSFIFPQITFWNMFKWKKVDARVFVSRHDSVRLNFIRYTERKYEIKLCKVLKDIDMVNEKERCLGLRD